jgi:hypothetical protein
VKLNTAANNTNHSDFAAVAVYQQTSERVARKITEGEAACAEKGQLNGIAMALVRLTSYSQIGWVDEILNYQTEFLRRTFEIRTLLPKPAHHISYLTILNASDM